MTRIRVGDIVQASRGNYKFCGSVTRIFRGMWGVPQELGLLSDDCFDLRCFAPIVQLKITGLNVPEYALLRNCDKVSPWS